MLHLITLPALMNSVLTHCYNPILAIVANNLDMAAVCESARQLSMQRSIADSSYSPVNQVRRDVVYICRASNVLQDLHAIRWCPAGRKLIGMSA